MMDKDVTGRRLDGAIESWARADRADAATVARLIERTTALGAMPRGGAATVTQVQPEPRGTRWGGWVSGAAMAAAVAAAAIVLPRQDITEANLTSGGTATYQTAASGDTVEELVAGGTALASADVEDAAIDSFALLFTPTYEEELVI